MVLRFDFGDTRDPKMVADIKLLVGSDESIQCARWCFRIARFGRMDNQLRASLWISDEWIIDAFAWKLAIDEVLRVDVADVVLVEHGVDIVSFVNCEDVPIAVN